MEERISAMHLPSDKKPYGIFRLAGRGSQEQVNE
jgi:hypothetical protein